MVVCLVIVVGGVVVDDDDGVGVGVDVANVIVDGNVITIFGVVVALLERGLAI